MTWTPLTVRAAMVAAALALACPAGAASAHDFWIHPEAFWLQPGATTPMTLQVGHGPDRQRSRIPAGRITRFEAVSPAGAKNDLKGSLTLGAARADGALRFRDAGAHMVVLETDDTARSLLPAARFNDYARLEGLTPALEARVRTGRMGEAASERYGRRAKAIIQVGEGGPQEEVTRPVGLVLEIVPEVSPYASPRPESLPVRVWYRSRPLAGALVKLTDLDRDAAPFEMRRTGADGRARFTMPGAGRWRLNVVWTQVLPEDETVDFETVFSSLAFGFADGPVTP